MGMDKIIIHKGRGLFHDHRKATRILAIQLNECIDYINWLENKHGEKLQRIEKLEARVDKLENIINNNDTTDLREVFK